jgi:hypothetical protein
MGRVMVGVVFVFVREDASDVEALAEAFDQAGYSISGSERCDDGLNIIVWSRAAMRSEAFRKAAERALQSDRVVVARLALLPQGDILSSAPVADISGWDGDDPRGLEPLFDIVLDLVSPMRPSVIALPARPLYEDAEFVEAPSDRSQQARAAWETPIPAKVLHPVPDPPAPQKLGAQSPRRDFRRLPQRHSNARAYAALIFAFVTLSAGSLAIAAAQNFSATPQPKAHAVEIGGVSLSSASAEALGLEDVAPTERERLYEPPVQVGRAGFEPPSARRASYRP